MVEICICCAPKDADAAHTIASRLERTADLHVRVEQNAAPLNENWDLGLDSAGLLLLLSPSSVPQRSDREVWSALLEHLQQNAQPSVASMLIQDCRFPPILRRNHFFEWHDPKVLRELQAWAITLHPPIEPAGVSPASLADAAAAPEYLWTMLVDGSGVATVADVRMAQEFAHRAARHFRDVVWVAMEGRSAEFVQTEFEEAMRARKHRVLVVLDGTEAILEEESTGSGSVIIIPPAEREQSDCESRLWQAMAACAPGSFPLELPLEMAGEGDPGALEEAGLIDCLDRGRRLYRLRRRPAVPADMRPLHAQSVGRRLSRWRSDPNGVKRMEAEVESALEWALRNDWEMACRLGRNAADYFRHRNSLPEAAAVLESIVEEADRRGDLQAERDFLSELSWIRNDLVSPMRAAPAEQMTLDLLL